MPRFIVFDVKPSRYVRRLGGSAGELAEKWGEAPQLHPLTRVLSLKGFPARAKGGYICADEDVPRGNPRGMGLLFQE